MLLVFLIGSAVAVQFWAWRSLVERLRAGTLSRVESVSRYTGWAFLPVLLFVAGFAAMVGIEEWLQVALVEERSALLALPVFGLSVLGMVVFTIRCAFLRVRQGPQ